MSAIKQLGKGATVIDPESLQRHPISGLWIRDYKTPVIKQCKMKGATGLKIPYPSLSHETPKNAAKETSIARGISSQFLSRCRLKHNNLARWTIDKKQIS